MIESYELTGSVEEVLEEFPRLTEETVLELIDHVKVKEAQAA